MVSCRKQFWETLLKILMHLDTDRQCWQLVKAILQQHHHHAALHAPVFMHAYMLVQVLIPTAVSISSCTLTPMQQKQNAISDAVCQIMIATRHDTVR